MHIFNESLLSKYPWLLPLCLPSPLLPLYLCLSCLSFFLLAFPFLSCLPLSFFLSFPTEPNYAEMNEESVESVAYFGAAAWTLRAAASCMRCVYLSCLARLVQLLSNRKKYRSNNNNSNNLLRPREHQQKVQECSPQSFDELARRLFWHTNTSFYALTGHTLLVLSCVACSK